MSGPSPRLEPLLLCAAARPGLAGDFDEALELNVDGVDWESLVRAAYDHGVTGLLCQALSRASGGLVPDEIRHAAREHLRRQSEAHQALADQLTYVLEGLGERGIEAIPFKGPTLAESAYEKPMLRAARDLDVLVRAVDARPAIAALVELGYQLTTHLTGRQWQAFLRYSGQDLLTGPGAPVEPHWTFTPWTLAVELDYAGIWTRADRRPFNGAEVLRLSPEDELTILCVHGAKERWPKLKWVADVAAYLDSHPALDWDRMLQRASSQGVARMLAVGLRLAELLLRAEVPEQAARRIVSDETGQELAARLAATMLDAERPKASVYDLSPFHLAVRERGRDKLRYLFRTVTQPRITHFESLPLPDSLFPLYWPYKLWHDYLALPAWRVLRSLSTGRSKAGVDAAG